MKPLVLPVCGNGTRVPALPRWGLPTMIMSLLTLLLQVTIPLRLQVIWLRVLNQDLKTSPLPVMMLHCSAIRRGQNSQEVSDREKAGYWLSTVNFFRGLCHSWELH